ncbi:hypothetical protein L9F63_007480, partial [Diploptera punctata]
KDISKVPMILADVNDEKSLKEMAAQARVIVNCVGPYILYGESVVKSCLDAGAHHVDISAEPQFLELMQLKYHMDAIEKGLYVIGSCGMDCIPMDLGIVFLKRQFQGDVNSAEIYQDMWYDDPLMTGPVAHRTSFESAMQIIANYKELRQIRSRLFPKPLPQFKPTLKRRRALHRRSRLGWCIPHVGTERSIIMRSQRHMFEINNERPVQVQVYMVMKSLLSIMLLVFTGILFSILVRFQVGRDIMLKFPSFFSGGKMDEEGPSEELRKSFNYKATLFGEGWLEKLAEPTDQHKFRPNKKVIVEVTCKDPGYTSTCIMLLLSAITILKESDKMPNRGGVYPPGAVFENTSIVEELNHHGLNFKVVSSK